jgi:hypothetical protein
LQSTHADNPLPGFAILPPRRLPAIFVNSQQGPDEFSEAREFGVPCRQQVGVPLDFRNGNSGSPPSMWILKQDLG